MAGLIARGFGSVKGLNGHTLARPDRVEHRQAQRGSRTSSRMRLTICAAINPPITQPNIELMPTTAVDSATSKAATAVARPTHINGGAGFSNQNQAMPSR